MAKAYWKGERISAGELSRKAMSDETKYDAIDIGHAMVDGIDKHLDECIETHLNYTNEEGIQSYRMLDEFCVVMVIAKDNLIKNVIRRKFYCQFYYRYWYMER